MTAASALMLLLTHTASAAEATELAPWLRGDVDITYGFAAENARLLEDGTAVGTRDTLSHTVDFAGEFTAGPGIAVYFDLPFYAGTDIRYADTYTMIIDPNTDSGTYLGAAAASEDPSVSGKGLGGTWLGLKGTPFSEDLFAKRGDKVTWLIDVGFRFPDKSNLWTVSEDGQRGAGPGSSAFRLKTAFSTHLKWTEPYMVASLTRSGPAKNVALVDADGTQLTDDAVSVQPASEMALRAGLEVVAVNREAVGARFAIDAHTDFGYRSWQDIPSGIFLPDVLDSSRSALATQGEAGFVSAGLSLNYRIMEWVQLNVGGDLGTIMPQQVEHFYDVGTGMGTTTWGINTTLKIRGRDRPERMLWDPKPE